MGNESKQRLIKETMEVSMQERGITKEAVVQKVFKEIHSQIYKTVGKPIIQVETEAVFIDEMKEVVEKKGVLQKSKKLIEMKVRVVLQVKYLDI